MTDRADGAGAAFGLEPLYVGRPNIGDWDRFLERMADIRERRWFTNNGRYVQEFEARIAEQLAVRNCIVTANATVALEAVIQVLGLTGSVIVPSFTFIASAHALWRQGIEPIFCDVDPVTHTLDPDDVERRIRADTSGILGVHLWGNGCDVERLQAIADRRGLKLMFDAAHAFGAAHKGVPIGRFGRAEVFSFHATKAINSFEGGAITTDDDALARRLRLHINFGFADYDEVVALGTNGKMSEPSAAMGLTSLEAMPAIVAANRANHALYRRRLDALPGLRVLDYDPKDAGTWHYVVLTVDPEAAGLDRDTLHRRLTAENIFARRYFHPGCHRSEPYRTRLAGADLRLPVTERLADTVLCLPTGTTVGADAVNRVCDAVEAALAAAAPRPHAVGA